MIYGLNFRPANAFPSMTNAVRCCKDAGKSQNKRFFLSAPGMEKLHGIQMITCNCENEWVR